MFEVQYLFPDKRAWYVDVVVDVVAAVGVPVAVACLDVYPGAFTVTVAVVEEGLVLAVRPVTTTSPDEFTVPEPADTATV